MKEIDNFVNDDAREDMPLDVHLKRLLELQDKSMLLHHPVAKVKRQKLLRQEITKVRRKLSMDKAGKTPGKLLQLLLFLLQLLLFYCNYCFFLLQLLLL